MSSDLIPHLLDQWSSKSLRSGGDLLRVYSELASSKPIDVNMFVTDVSSGDPWTFKTISNAEGVSLRGDTTTFDSYPDQDYVRNSVIPANLRAIEVRRPTVQRLTERIQNFQATYDRLIIPTDDGRNLSLTHTKLLLPMTDSPLTPREENVLDAMSSGLSAREVADKFGMSHRTVENYAASAKEKLAARSIAHATAIWTARRIERSD